MHPSNDRSVDVYVSGNSLTVNNHSIATYWKNGTPTKLGDTTLGFSRATSIVSDGINVYAAGVLFYNSVSIPTYWKNGAETRLSNGSLTASVSGIALNGSDIYVAGSDSGTAVYWKNGVKVKLTYNAQYSTANAIAIKGTDIYVGGSYIQPNGYSKAIYWENGIAIPLVDTSQESSINAITVNNNDVYMVGNTDYFAKATYWKNGAPTIVTNGYSTAIPYGIAVDGSDVYMAGVSVGITQGGINKLVSTVWKNGTPTRLTGENFGASDAEAIALHGTDVYVTGDNGYWKNGVVTQFGTNAQTFGIWLVPH